MKIYPHRTWRDLDAWGVWDKPWLVKDAKLVATILRLRGLYCATLTDGKVILTPRWTFWGAKREISKALDWRAEFE